MPLPLQTAMPLRSGLSTEQRPEPQENAASKIREDEWLGLGGSNRLILSGVR